MMRSVPLVRFSAVALMIIGQVWEVSADDFGETAKVDIKSYAVSTMNSALSDSISTMLGEHWKYLSMSTSLDGDTPSLDAMAVYGMYENKNWFVFNQSSLVSYDSSITLNYGIGVRHINDPETIILGGNIFQDYELGSGHRRFGFGLEALSSIFQLRANYYKALTSEITYEGVEQQALDGYDVKLNYELPYFNSSSLFVKFSNWTDGVDYNTNGREFGFAAEVVPNLSLSVSDVTGTTSDQGLLASVTYSIPLGGKRHEAVVRDGKFKSTLQPIRYMLYQPVQRENKIMKKTARFGITVSGY